MEPSEAKRKRFSRLSEEEIQNLIEGKDSENTRKATKNAVVTFLAYWNEVKPEDERVKNTESLEKIPKKELNELLANFWPNAKETERRQLQTVCFDGNTIWSSKTLSPKKRT